jgi:hypothetical protein
LLEGSQGFGTKGHQFYHQVNSLPVKTQQVAAPKTARPTVTTNNNDNNDNDNNDNNDNNNNDNNNNDNNNNDNNDMSYNWSSGESGGNYQFQRMDDPGNGNAKNVVRFEGSSGALVVGDNDVGPGTIHLHETGASGQKVVLVAPASLSADVTLTMPDAQNTAAGQIVATSDTSGTLTWTDGPFFVLCLGHAASISNSATFLRATDGVQNDEGICLVSDGSINKMSVQLKCTTYTGGPHTVTVQLWVNGANSSKTITLDPGSTGSAGVAQSITAEAVTEGDTVTAKVLTSSANCVVDNVVVSMRVNR